MADVQLPDELYGRKLNEAEKIVIQRRLEEQKLKDEQRRQKELNEKMEEDARLLEEKKAAEEAKKVKVVGVTDRRAVFGESVGPVKIKFLPKPDSDASNLQRSSSMGTLNNLSQSEKEKPFKAPPPASFRSPFIPSCATPLKPTSASTITSTSTPGSNTQTPVLPRATLQIQETPRPRAFSDSTTPPAPAAAPSMSFGPRVQKPFSTPPMSRAAISVSATPFIPSSAPITAPVTAPSLSGRPGTMSFVPPPAVPSIAITPATTPAPAPASQTRVQIRGSTFSHSSSHSTPAPTATPQPPPLAVHAAGLPAASTAGPDDILCAVCSRKVYKMEEVRVDSTTGALVLHTWCFRCHECNGKLSLGRYAAVDGTVFCKPHFKQLFSLKGNYDEGFGKMQRKHEFMKDLNEDSFA